jgi:hypothetical protein
MRSKLIKKLTLEDLEYCDSMYWVGNIVDIDSNGWVTKGEAEEILDICNSHIDAITEMANETIDKNQTE